MDKLTAIKAFVGIMILCIFFPGCTPRTVKFIYLDEVLEKYSDSSQQQVFDLDNFLYLNPKIANVVDKRYPGLLAKRRKDISDFVISEDDKLTINLNRKYQRIEDVTKNLDPDVVRGLKNNFGIEDPEKYVKERILVYKNSAFLEFVAPGSVHAVTLELRENQQLSIGIAFIIVE